MEATVTLKVDLSAFLEYMEAHEDMVELTELLYKFIAVHLDKVGGKVLSIKDCEL